MSWKRIVFQVNADQLDELESHLWDFGAVSVTVTDPEDNPIYEPPPGETPLWQEVNVAGLFEENADVQSIVHQAESVGFHVLSTDELADRLWEREWMSEFEPMRFGERLWVCPTGFEVVEANAVILDLDPGLAFGTGTHSTTRMCLEWLDANPIEGRRVLDFGCGSGILGIAALLLGASEVVAIDNDPQALTATVDNATRNGVEARVVTGLPGDIELAEFDIVLANILAKPLIDLSGLLCAPLKSGGDVVLSGILATQQDWVESAYIDHVKLIDQFEHEGWVCLHGRK